MGWESSNDTYTELKLNFLRRASCKLCKKKKIDFELIEPRKEKLLKIVCR